MKNVHARPEHAAAALAMMESFHSETVDEVARAVAEHDVVMVGMAQNPFPPKARRLLNDAGIAFHELSYGSYLSQWQPRLALKMWSGWPTFPMIFARGTLIGGASELKVALEDGSLRALLDAEPSVQTPSAA